MTDAEIIKRVNKLVSLATEGVDTAEAIADLTSALCTVVALAGLQSEREKVALRVAEMVVGFPYSTVMEVVN